MSGATRVWPALRYADARAAIVFLVEAFGFEEKAVYGEGSRVDHAELVWPGGGGVMLGSPREDSVLGELPSGVGAVYLVTDDRTGCTCGRWMRRLRCRRSARRGLRLARIHVPRSGGRVLEFRHLHR